MIPQNSAKANLSTFFRQFKLGRLLAQAGFRSRTLGMAPLAILQFLIGLICTERNLWRWFHEQSAESLEALPFHKSTVYALLRNPRVNWRQLLLTLSVATTRWVKRFSTRRDAVFIVDDSLFDRHRSRAVDFLSRVYDHVAHRYRWGFRWLTIGWSDGTTFLPVLFSLLGSQQAHNRRNPTVSSIDKRTVGAKRRREALQSAPALVVQGLQEALAAGLSARSVLFDRWFTTIHLVGDIVHQTGLHVIGMVKASPHLYYEFEGRRWTLNPLYRHLRGQWSRHTLMGSLVATVVTPQGPLRVRIVLVRDHRSASKEWLALWSTHGELPDDEVVRIYGKRWASETFFKVAKSLLGIPREYQGRAYEGCIAHVTLVCIRYQWLALEARKEEDVCTLGELFYAQCQELQDITFAAVMDQIFTAFAATLNEYLDLSEEQIDALFQRFLTRIPVSLRERITRYALIELLKVG